MKVVINACYGGFGLSARAVKLYASKTGKECYFFKISLDDYEPLTIEQAETSLFFTTYSVPNPKDYKLGERDADGLYKSANKRADSIKVIDEYDLLRNDTTLIEVVEELGDKANGECANLKIVEIPNDIDWEISEYDGYEHIAEKHRTWG